MIVEVSKFQTKPGVSAEQFLAASKQAQEGFLATSRGFVGRELLRADDGTWLDIVRFDTAADANAAMEDFLGQPSTKLFEQAIDPSSVETHHFEIAQQF